MKDSSLMKNWLKYWVVGSLFFAQAVDARTHWLDLSLEEALVVLEQRGLQMVYTSQVVRPEMRVTHAPTARAPRALLDQLLTPHGLMARESVNNVLIIVPADSRQSPPEDEESSPPERVSVHDRIEVTSNRLGLLGENISALNLERDKLLILPNIGGDAFRPLTILPGTSGNDVSARFNVRGGRRDEVMVRLDGFELLEPYHLKDLDSALSLLEPSILGGVELLTGGFTAEYGDRMSGVLEVSTLDPDWRHQTELGLSPAKIRAADSGTFRSSEGGDRGGGWLTSLRGGLLALTSKVADLEEEPAFWDFLAKFDLQLGTRSSFRAHLLFSGDRLTFLRQSDGSDESAATGGADRLEQFRTSYHNAYLWLTHQRVFNPERYLESRASWTRIGIDRASIETEDDLSLMDVRAFDMGAVSGRAHFRLGEHHGLKWGYEGRALDVDYAYINTRVLSDPLALIRDRPQAALTQFNQDFRDEQYGLYVADRMEWARWTWELGLRFDRNTVLDDDSYISPRLSWTWALGEQTRFLGSWGYFYQSQRLYELQVEDGETGFFPSERSEHKTLGFEQTLGRGAGAVFLRAEIYERRIRDPRVRFENLFDPISLVPELENDRVRIAPELSLSQGFELLVGGQLGAKIDWLCSYAYARVDDRIDGNDVRRGVDQPQKLGLNIDFRPPGEWSFHLAWELRAGWPTTAISATSAVGDDGEFEVIPALGPLNGERLPDYQRVDLRVARDWRLKKSRLSLFLDVQNVLDTRNVRGFDIGFELRDNGEVEVFREEKYWGRILPNLSLRWTF